MLIQLELFSHDELYLGIAVRQHPRPPRVSFGWQVADHACRYCFGRVLTRSSGSRVLEVRCAECGTSVEGADVSQLCCCGAQCGDLDYPLICVKNPQVSKEVPHEVIVQERNRGPQSERGGATRPVRIRDY